MRTAITRPRATPRVSSIVALVALVALVGVIGALIVARPSSAQAATPGFSNVVGQAGIMSVGAWGTYVGPGPITMTVGTTSDVYASKVAQVSATKTGPNNSFYLLATGLDSATPYWIHLGS